jgi:chemotaxis protein CheX
MNVEILNPFVEAATEVLSLEVKAKIQRGALTVQKSALTTDDITVIINLVGQIEGVVLLGMSFSTGLAFVSQMMEQTFKEFDNLAESGIAELGNVIFGKATVKLAQVGYQSTISTPNVITGNGIQISTLNFARIVVPLVTDFGELIVHLAIREKPNGKGSDDYIPLIEEAIKKQP